MTPVAWMVTYGDRQEYKALFCDRARAEQFAATHGGQVFQMFTANAEKQSTAPADPQSSAGIA